LVCVYFSDWKHHISFLENIITFENLISLKIYQKILDFIYHFILHISLHSIIYLPIIHKLLRWENLKNTMTSHRQNQIRRTKPCATNCERKGSNWSVIKSRRAITRSNTTLSRKSWNILNRGKRKKTTINSSKLRRLTNVSKSSSISMKMTSINSMICSRHSMREDKSIFQASKTKRYKNVSKKCSNIYP